MRKILFLFVLFLLLSSDFLAQIRIKEISSPLPDKSLNYSDTETRKIIPLNDDWIVIPKDSEQDGVKINIPSTYNSDAVMVFQKNLILSYQKIDDFIFRIHFLGISYSADIFLNEIAIYKKPGGNIPFTVELPNDLINNDGDNILKVVVKKKLDSRNSIPLLQRFLFPKNSGGIVRDVYLEIIPKENLQLTNYSTNIADNYKSAKLNFSFDSNLKPSATNDKYQIDISIIDKGGNVVSKQREVLLNRTRKNTAILTLKNVKIWTPENPNQYTAEFRLIKNDSLIDISRKKIVVAKFESRSDGIYFNNKKFNFKGVTYINSSKEYGELTNYSELKKDLQIIKSLGINSVRFAKATPHPFALEICSELGIIPFIELPLNSPPELIVQEENFAKRAERFADNFVKGYSLYSPFFAVGVGSGYLPNSKIHFNLISKLTKTAHNGANIVTYASFFGVPESRIDNLDLYGIELFDNLTQLENGLSNSSVNQNRIFISEATYPTYNGSTNGYLNKFSYEAQARFFEQTIDFAKSKNIVGFFINSMFDYYGDFSSLYTKYTKDNLYRIGILGTDKNINRISYNVIKSKINNSKRITIPLGSTKDDAPMLFIVVGLVLSLLMGVLINSKKKLREDATRALLRPYNFFADIRDHRIMSGFATIILMFILAGSHSLLIINLLFYFRDSLLFEKVLLAFGLPSLLSTINYFAWNPTEAFFFFLGFGVLFFLISSTFIFITSFFIKIKIYFRNIFFTVVWAVLPLALLLPIKMVLYRILNTEVINFYIYVFLALYFLWIARRIIKGIYVIFDISAGAAYLYSLIIGGIILGALLLYFQIYHSTIYYLINVFSQANLI